MYVELWSVPMKQYCLHSMQTTLPSYIIFCDLSFINSIVHHLQHRTGQNTFFFFAKHTTFLKPASI